MSTASTPSPRPGKTARILYVLLIVFLFAYFLKPFAQLRPIKLEPAPADFEQEAQKFPWGPDRKAHFDIQGFGALPVVANGRLKPLESFASSTLMVLSERDFMPDLIVAAATAPQEDAGAHSEQAGRKAWEMKPRFPGQSPSAKLNASEWLLEMTCGSNLRVHRPVFYITNLDLINKLKLDPKRERFRYAACEFVDQIALLQEDLESAAKRKAMERSAYDTQLLDFQQKIALFQILIGSFSMDIPQDPQAQASYRGMLRELRSHTPPLLIPTAAREEWQTLPEALLSGPEASSFPAAKQFALALLAFGNSDPLAFNEAVAALHAQHRSCNERNTVELQAQAAANAAALANLGEGEEALTRRAELEAEGRDIHKELDLYVRAASRVPYELAMLRIDPLGHAIYFYFLAFVLAAFSWVLRQRALNKVVLWFQIAVFLLHTWGLFSRVYISGYPPVTNLYSTAVFIGWAAVGAALLLEAIFKLGFGNICASLIGFVTLLIAAYLSLSGDTMQMMQAVLDTKFFLTIHVITINLGYAACYLGGVVALIYVLAGLMTKRLDAPTRQTLNSVMYGITCFAIFFSFIGTILGGIWADDSWGRFWGWDPKENGALLIVLWNAAILHARLCGLIRARGLALALIFGNVVTTWAYFGVNQLSVGLHSYGFTSSAAFWITAFGASQLLVIALGGFIPERYWRSCENAGKAS